MLSCECDYTDAEWYYNHPDDMEPRPLTTKRARRCCSCRDRIAVGDPCVAFERWREPEFESVAWRIHGDEEQLPTWYLCERCAGLYESLDELGFCNLLGQDLREVCREYAQMQREGGVFRGTMAVAAGPEE